MITGTQMETSLWILGYIEKHAVVAFIVVVAVLGVGFGMAILVSAYPWPCFVHMLHKQPMHKFETSYFYYQKATAYRMLFLVHTTFHYTVKIIGMVMTFVTVYCALDKNNYILFCSLMSAFCDILALAAPTDKYMRIYVQGARVLEYELNTEHNSVEEAKKN